MTQSPIPTTVTPAEAMLTTVTPAEATLTTVTDAIPTGAIPAPVISTPPIPAPTAPTALSRESAATVIAEARGRIDALDGEILDLVQRRIGISAEVQQARIATGGPRLSLTREMEILERYRERLGRPGTDIAMLLLELCRGRV